MRPFRFFFGLSLGIIFFVFLARFVLLALVMAAILSVAFHFGRKIKRFFQRLRWEEEEDSYFFRRPYRQSVEKPIWKGDLLWEYPNRQKDFVHNYRVVEVH